MLQLRPQSGDPRWFNPERDMLYAFPRLMRKVLVRFETMYPDNVELSVAETQKLAKLMAGIMEFKLPPEEIAERVTALDPQYCKQVGHALLLCFLHELPEWVKDVKMKDKPSPLTVDDLHRLADKVIGDYLAKRRASIWCKLTNLIKGFWNGRKQRRGDEGPNSGSAGSKDVGDNSQG